MDAGRRSYRIAYRQSGLLYRLTRIVYGNDGSYYVTAPVPPSDPALFLKTTVNYAKSETVTSFSEAIDLGKADDEDKEIKLSHHPDGFVQFSGAGLTSGFDDHGNIMGMGVRSWPLHSPVRGPAFGLVVNGPESILAEAKPSADTVPFEEADLYPGEGFDQIVLEGHYFPPLFRRFVRTDARGNPVIGVRHPSDMVLPLRVLFPHATSQVQGFLAIEVYTQPRPLNDDAGPGFFLSGSTGNLRRNSDDELLGDGVFCVYPADYDLPVARDLMFRSAPPDESVH